jgi:hypothetical protein
VLRGEARERGGQGAREDEGQADAHVAAELAGALRGRLPPGAQQGEGLARAPEERPTLGVEGDGAAGPVEEANAEALLEALHRLRDRGRRHAEPLGGAAKALLLGDGDEGGDPGEEFGAHAGLFAGRRR